MDDVDALEIDVQLVGGDLRQRGADALSQLDLAREDRHLARRLDDNPGVQPPVRVEAPRQARLVVPECPLRSECPPDDERAAGLDEVATGGAHDRISFAARCTARTMRLCEAHRHRWPLSACLTSWLVGLGFRSSSALAAITMPLPQKPHWHACSSMNARCRGWSLSTVPRPSMVVMGPLAAETGVTHEIGRA